MLLPHSCEIPVLPYMYQIWDNILVPSSAASASACRYHVRCLRWREVLRRYACATRPVSTGFSFIARLEKTSSCCVPSERSRHKRRLPSWGLRVAASRS